eukprot:g12833.t1
MPSAAISSRTGPSLAILQTCNLRITMPTRKTGKSEEKKKRAKEEKVKMSDQVKDIGGSVISSKDVFDRGVGTKEGLPADEEIDLFLASKGSEFRAFFTAFTFLTRVPGPSSVDHHPGHLMRGMAYFPILGTMIGFWGSVWFDAAAFIFSPHIAAAVCTAATIWLTGCFHEDGLVDTADGFGGGWTRAQVLRIMKDSRVGTYGAAALTLYLLVKSHLLVSLAMTPSAWAFAASAGAGPALLAAHTFARAPTVLMLRSNKYVTDAEDAKNVYYSWFARSALLLTRARVLFALLSATIVSSLLYGPIVGLTLFAMALVIAVSAGRYCNQVLGGVVGDFLGATTCMTELCVYAFLLNADSLVRAVSQLSQLRLSGLSQILPGHDAAAGLAKGPLGSLAMLLLITYLWFENVGRKYEYTDDLPACPADADPNIVAEESEE